MSSCYGTNTRVSHISKLATTSQIMPTGLHTHVAEVYHGQYAIVLQMQASCDR